jgi:hypothetical protein
MEDAPAMNGPAPDFAIAPRPEPLTPATGRDRLALAIAGFVALGVGLRIARFLVNEPLWGDEAFLAANLINRGYRQLLRPLDFGQICPVLFLWIELSVVRVLGYSEMSLRLFPLACSVASVLLFRHTAGRLVRGLPLLLAVGIFAVSFHPIRHGAEVKPYASDLLVALVLLALAVEWWRTPERSRWLWVLAGFAPVALAISYPAIFIATSIGLIMVPRAWGTRRRGTRGAFSLFGLAAAGTFVLLNGYQNRMQSKAAIQGLRAYWTASFPPAGSLFELGKWLVRTHTGSLFAYPGGGDHGASTATFLLFLSGAVWLWRRGRKEIVAVCLAPFALSLAAATLRCYPYGGEARLGQYLAPSICLLAGIGAAALVARIPGRRQRHAVLRAAVVLLIALGLVPLGREIGHPYRMEQDRLARNFARWFWPAQAREAELVCLCWDFGVVNPKAGNLWPALYLCNQRIYSPPRQRGERPQWERISLARPLRCVVTPGVAPDDPRVVACLDRFTPLYALRGRRTVSSGHARAAQVVVFEFVPRDRPPLPRVASGNRSAPQGR